MTRLSNFLRQRGGHTFLAGILGGSILTTLGVGAAKYSNSANAAPRTSTNDAQATALETADVAPTRVKLEPDELKQVRTQVLREQDLTDKICVNGRITFNEDRTSLIIAPINGQVTGLRLKVGDRVAKGDTLFFINGRDVAAAQSEYLEGRKDLELAEKTLAMTQDLFNHQAASSIALQQADNDRSKAATRLSRTKEQLRVLGLNPAEVEARATAEARISIRSPIDGVIVERHLTEGQFVQGDATPLLTIADLSSVWVQADIFERDLHLIQEGQDAQVSTMAYPSEKFPARVSHISNVVDPLTRTVKARLLVQNPDGRLKPDMFASIDLMVGRHEHALAIPMRAILSEGGRSLVLVRKSANEFESRMVDLTAAAKDSWRVLSGLAAGDEVIIEGALLVRQAMTQVDNG